MFEELLLQSSTLFLLINEILKFFFLGHDLKLYVETGRFLFECLELDYLRFKPRRPGRHHVRITSLGGRDRSVPWRKLKVHLDDLFKKRTKNNKGCNKMLRSCEILTICWAFSPWPLVGRRHVRFKDRVDASACDEKWWSDVPETEVPSSYPSHIPRNHTCFDPEEMAMACQELSSIVPRVNMWGFNFFSMYPAFRRVASLSHMSLNMSVAIVCSISYVAKHSRYRTRVRQHLRVRTVPSASDIDPNQ